MARRISSTSTRSIPMRVASAVPPGRSCPRSSLPDDISSSYRRITANDRFALTSACGHRVSRQRIAHISFHRGPSSVSILSQPPVTSTSTERLLTSTTDARIRWPEHEGLRAPGREQAERAEADHRTFRPSRAASLQRLHHVLRLDLGVRGVFVAQRMALSPDADPRPPLLEPGRVRIQRPVLGGQPRKDVGRAADDRDVRRTFLEISGRIDVDMQNFARRANSEILPVMRSSKRAPTAIIRSASSIA
jgi:hypothetical protein